MWSDEHITLTINKAEGLVTHQCADQLLNNQHYIMDVLQPTLQITFKEYTNATVDHDISTTILVVNHKINWNFW